MAAKIFFKFLLDSADLCGMLVVLSEGFLNERV
jgi:hypothetical protein